MLKSWVRGALHRRGLDLVREPNVLTFLEVHGVDLVIDVGANVGQYASGLRNRGYRGRIWSFEPIDAAFEQLESAARADDRWLATRTAVGAATGEAILNVSELSVFSSIKPVNQTALDFDARAVVVEKQLVPVATLDHLLKDEPSRRIFLKIDTQGFEKEVLEGTSGLRDKLVGIQLEVPVENLYDNVWTFPACISFMDELGYVPAQFKIVNPRSNDRASAVEFDCIFRPKR